MKTCVTCGEPLELERAERYEYCTRPDCRAQNAKPFEIVGIGVNKAAEQFVALTDRTRREMETGRYKRVQGVPSAKRRGVPPKRVSASEPAAKPRPQRRPWRQAQQELAVIYRDRGIKPDEIAEKLGVSRYLVTQMLLSATNRGKP